MCFQVYAYVCVYIYVKLYEMTGKIYTKFRIAFTSEESGKKTVVGWICKGIFNLIRCYF